MQNERYKQLLAALQASEYIDDPTTLDREAASSRLYEYIDYELAGEQAATILPDVAFFIASDAEFAADYNELKTLIQTVTTDELPEITLDMQRINTSSSTQPKQPAVDPIQQLLNWATQQLAAWQTSLPQLGMALRSQRLDIPPITLDGLAQEVQLHLSIVQRVRGADLTGIVRPSAPELHERAVRLYRATVDGKQIETLLETSMSDLDRFTFSNIPVGHYTLTIAFPAEEKGIFNLVVEQKEQHL